MSQRLRPRDLAFLAEETPSPHSPFVKAKALRVHLRPHPVAGIISPWNFPLILSLGDAIPALVAGCAVVIKPSEFTPLSLIEVVEAWKHEIGGPDVLAVVNGKAETGEALVDHAHLSGLQVFAWTLREESRFLASGSRDASAELTAMLDAGVDGVFCDQPDVALAARDAWRPARAAR